MNIAAQQAVGSAIDFDLIAHPASRTALIACTMLGGSGLTAIILEAEAYIADGYSFLGPHVFAGLGGFALFLLVLERIRRPMRLPVGIPLGVSLVGGIASAIFSYGGLVILNRFVAEATTVSYSVSRPCTTLVSADPGIPRIIFSPGFSDYWCEVEEGTKLLIPVRKGLFGTYQFDQEEYVKKIKAYREKARTSRAK
jgi:hypothetical protein